MNCLLLFLATVGEFLFLAASPLAAAEPTADDYLNFFKPFAGEWTVKANFGGTTAEAKCSFRVSLEGRCLVWRGSDLGELPAIESIDGYDPGTKTWKCCAFTREGHRVTYYSAVDAKSLKGKQAAFRFKETATKPNGVTINSQAKITFIMGDRQIRSVVKDLTVDNEKKPDQEWTFDRRKEPDSELPFKKVPAGTAKSEALPLLQDFGQMVAGRWVGKMTMLVDWPGFGKKGEVVTGQVTFQWVADGRGLEGADFLGLGTNKALYFWDPVAKRIKHFQIDSGGTTWEGQIWKEGGQWVSRGAGSYVDGTKFRVEAVISLRDGGNSLVYTGAVTVDGQKSEKFEDVYKRAAR